MRVLAARILPIVHTEQRREFADIVRPAAQQGPALDTEFLLRPEMRPFRFALEYSKADILLSDWGIRSTIIVFAPPGFVPAPGIAEGARLRMGQALMRLPLSPTRHNSATPTRPCHAATPA